MADAQRVECVRFTGALGWDCEEDGVSPAGFTQSRAALKRTHSMWWRGVFHPPGLGELRDGRDGYWLTDLAAPFKGGSPEIVRSGVMAS